MELELDLASERRLYEAGIRPSAEIGLALLSRLEQAEQAVERKQEALDTVARIVETQCEAVVLATGSQDLIGNDLDGDWDAVWGRLSELADAKRTAEQAVQRVRELHEEYVIYAWDGEVNFPKLDANGQKVVLARLCRACSSEDGIGAAEDGEWDDGYDDVDYPCPTIRALDGDGRG